MLLLLHLSQLLILLALRDFEIDGRTARPPQLYLQTQPFGTEVAAPSLQGSSLLHCTADEARYPYYTHLPPFGPPKRDHQLD